MKYVFTLLAIVFGLLAVPAFAQEQATTAPAVAPKIEDMDYAQFQAYQKMLKAQTKSSALTTLENLTPERVNKYAEMGKGLGVAINEGLSAVTKNVEQFSQTSAGKWIMVLVTWKVMGEDAVGLVRQSVRFLVGISLLAVGVPFFIYIYRRNCVAQPLLKSKTTVGWITIKKEYEGMSKPIHDDAGPWGYAVCFAIFIGINVLIMFV